MTASQAHDGPSYLTSGEVARLLGISDRTYRRYLKDGRLSPHHRTPTGHARFLETDVRALMAPASAGQPAA